MAAIAISPAVQLSNSPEARKALSIPVPGAVVIAPLTQSWRNYGSAGGEFTRVGTPTLSSNGASFNGAGQAAWLDAGSASEFTLIFRLSAAAAPNASWLITTMQPASAYGGYGVYRYTVTSPTNWCIGAPAGTEVASTMAINALGVYSLVRRGTNLELYKDGAQVANAAVTTPTASSRLILCARGAPAGIDGFCAATIHRPAQFNSALSDTDRALVEAWAAA